MQVENGYRVRFITMNRFVTLPVNPLEVSVQYDGDNTNYNVVGIGDVIVQRTPKLAQVSFDSFFPRLGEFSYTNDEYQEPSYYVDFFRTLQNDKTLFKLVITRSVDGELLFDTNFYAVLNSFQITDKGGEPGDVYYTMSISEWRDTQPELLEVKEAGEVDKDGNTIKPKKLVAVKQRKQNVNKLKTGQTVTVSGNVYNTDTQTETEWQKTKTKIAQSTCVISRVLPPEMNSGRVYIEGLGWVSKSSCITSNAYNTGNDIKDLIK